MKKLILPTSLTLKRARVRVDRDDLRAGGGAPGGGLTEVLDFSLRGRLQAPCVGTGLAFLALLSSFAFRRSQEGRVPAQREEREQPRVTMVERAPDPLIGADAGRSRGDALRVRVWRQTRQP